MKKRQLRERYQLFLETAETSRTLLSRNSTTAALSSFSPWENLALIMEGLGVTVQGCLREGHEKEEVYRAIRNYLPKVLIGYEAS